MKTRALFTLLASALSCCAAVPAVQLWETNLVIPTYLAAPPSPVPRFYDGRTYQGAKATFYPYPVQDVLTDIKTNKSYKALFLENDYVQISLIPELGGRIWSAMDKANGYDFFYRQHVVKPALIGMLGAWISGGVEWNVPHHHRASSFMPVDYTTTTNADGSATIWVGEIELRHRMKWLVGMTLYPDRSYLELTCKVFNRTPFAWPMLFWINPAVHANTNYQVLFPPGTEWTVQHGKPEFASWPIARQNYGGSDYTRGVDISWWKNHDTPKSFFAWNYEDDWFGGYDHGRQAGVIHWADHHVAPGKKFFEWGNGPEGEMWTKILTDDDGPYLELMAGAWSDNQPDYSWIQPGETREWKHWWYPIRNMGGVKAATRDAAVDLEVTNGVVKVAINATAAITNANVDLLLWGTNSPWGWSTNIGPRETVTIQAPLSEMLMDESCVAGLGVTVSRMAARRRDDVVLVKYSPHPPTNSPMPKAVEKPKPPKDYASTDEIYFTGQRIEQLYSPSFEAAPYYVEILRRDPGDYRANTAMGILLCKQWRWNDAAKFLSNAVARGTANYIRPQDGEAWYYLGVALRGQAGLFGGRAVKDDHRMAMLAEAAGAFQKASWSAGWQSPSFFHLAEMQCGQNRLNDALESVDRCLAVNRRNPKAMDLRSAILRHQGRFDEAAVSAAEALSVDPLDTWSPVECYLVSAKTNPGSRAVGYGGPEVRIPPRLLAKSVGELAELVVDYANAGLETEAGDVAWSATIESGPDVRGDCKLRRVDPLLHYYAGYFASGFELSGLDMQYGGPFLIPGTNCFPFQHEMVEVLNADVAASGRAESCYQLGNLLYDNRPAEAIAAWECVSKQAQTSPPARERNLFALIHRNLALAYAQHEKNIPKAIASLEKAIELDPTEPRFFYELDVQYDAGGAPVAKRLEMLTKHHAIVAQRDDALTREIELLTFAGQADRALELLRGRHFRNWEGSSQIHSVYVDACLTHGQKLLAQKKPREALREFEAAFEYPENLEVGKSRRSPRMAHVQYLIGTAHEALGDPASAKAAFEKAAGARGEGASESVFFRARALEKLGRVDEAQPMYERLVKAGEEQFVKGEAADYFAKFGERQSERVRQANAHYLIGLGQLGLKDEARAQAAFRQALELHPAHLGVATQSAIAPTR